MKREEDTLSVNFKALLSALSADRWIILGVAIVFLCVGTYYAFSLREEFVSKGRILPEVSGGGASSIGGLADLVGIGGFEVGLKNNTDAIRPAFYPDILKSTPFYLDLLEQKVLTQDNDSIGVEAYMREILDADKEGASKKYEPEEGLIAIDINKELIINSLKERIEASIDNKTGMIHISAKMPDPVISARIAKRTIGYLTKYITEYRTEKRRKEVDFLGQKVSTAREVFYKQQLKKANYEDQFAAPTIRMNVADVRRERLEAEYKLSSALYNELLKKHEEAKIKLQQETPVFKILEPPTVPNYKSEPKRLIILIVSLLLGLLIPTVISVLKNRKQIFILS